MKKLPKYIKKNGFDIFHFRIKVPQCLVKIIGKTEICRSLRTSCEITARRKAQVLAHEAELLFRNVYDSLEQTSDPIRVSNEYMPRLSLQSGDVHTISRKKTVRVRKKGGNELVERKILLSEMITEFVEAKELEGVWKPSEKQKNQRMLKEMNDYLGDKFLDEYTKADARKYKSIVTQLPKRTSNKSMYDGLGLAECVQRKPENAKTLSLSTVNKYVEISSSAFTWAVEEEYISTNRFKGMSYSKKAMKRNGVDTRPESARNVLCDEDILQLFSGLPMNSLRPRKASYPLDYWGVLIAAYTGARASEIAQLLFDDIVEKHGIWCFQFANDHDENKKFDQNRSQKSNNALRCVPIHDVIIEAGFQEYVDQIESGLLFPQEKAVRGRFGHRLSKDFGTYRKDMDVDGNGQTFHGFRHSHANKLRDADINSKLISDLHGRARGNNETDIRYIKRHKVAELNRAIQLVDYVGATKYLPTWSRIKNNIEFKRVNAQGGTRKKDRLG